MNYSQIGIFIALAKYNNFTQTANNLHVSQPLISKQIAALEEEIGVTLFQRDHHKVAITPAGEFMLEYYKRWKDEYAAVIQKAVSIQENRTSLKIGMMEHTDLQELPEAVHQFSETYPSCQLQFGTCYYAEVHRLVETDRDDLVIGLAAAFDSLSGISHRELKKGHNYLILSQKHPKYKSPELTLKDFQGERFVLPEGNDTHPLRELSFSAFSEYGISPGALIAVNGFDAMLQTVLSGIAVAIVNFGPGYIQGYDALRFLEIGADSDYWIVWKNTNENPMIPIFCDLLEQKLELI
jgi:DNA-binding transcriptional LysR family regulator